MNEGIKGQIQVELEKLVGLQLTRTTRAADMECLKFGSYTVVDKAGDLYSIGAIGLHLQCAWRITKGREIVVGSSDLFESVKPEEPEEFDWETDGNYRDWALGEVIKSAPIILTVEADDWGGFRIGLGAYEMSVFPHSGKRSEYTEYWRLIFNAEVAGRHFVVGPDGIWDSEKKPG